MYMRGHLSADGKVPPQRMSSCLLQLECLAWLSNMLTVGKHNSSTRNMCARVCFSVVKLGAHRRAHT